MEKSLVESFSKQQKLSLITLVRIISNGCQDQNKVKLQDKAIRQQADFLGLNFSDCENYLNNLNPANFQNEFQGLTNIQKDLAVSMAYEILLCGGEPSERDYIIAENSFSKIANIDNDEFLKRIEKIQEMGNFFFK
jgi:hypothetical protein